MGEHQKMRDALQIPGETPDFADFAREFERSVPPLQRGLHITSKRCDFGQIAERSLYGAAQRWFMKHGQVEAVHQRTEGEPGGASAQDENAAG